MSKTYIVGSRYQIQSRIGEGGMAAVYLAIDKKLDRKVAIKILHEHMEKSPEIRRRFHQEAKSISSLDHPNILKIYDFSGLKSKRLWIVTEIINGYSLGEYTNKFCNGFLHPIIASIVIREICKALEAAHTKGIVHRDIKPENVMLTNKGQIILMDFGIAKDLQEHSLTQTGTFMGSPSYMSIEQIKGLNIDHRTDIYSLGVVFYELITGKLPYSGQSTHDLASNIISGKYMEPRYLVDNLSPEINRIILKCMNLKKDQRPEKIKHVGQYLDQFLSSYGFVESHIELERYFRDRATYEARLDLLNLKMNRKAPTPPSSKPIINTYDKITSIDNYKVKRAAPPTFRTSKINKNKTQAIQSQAEAYKKTSVKHPNKIQVKDRHPEMGQRKPKIRKPQTRYTQAKTVHGRRQAHLAHKTYIYQKQKHDKLAAYQRAYEYYAYKQSIKKKNDFIINSILFAIILMVISYGVYFISIHSKQHKQILTAPPKQSEKIVRETKSPIKIKDIKEKSKKTTTQNIKENYVEPVKSLEDSKTLKQVKERETKPGVQSVFKSWVVTTPPRKRTPKPSSSRPKNATEAAAVSASVPRALEIATPANQADSEPKKIDVEATEISDGYIRLQSVPASEIFIDGISFDTSSNNSGYSKWIKLPLGSHELVLKRRGYQDHTQSLVIEDDRRITLPKIYLEKIKTANRVYFLNIDTNKVPVTIRIMNTKTGSIVYNQVANSENIGKIELNAGTFDVKIKFMNQVKKKQIQLPGPSRSSDYSYSVYFKSEGGQ